MIEKIAEFLKENRAPVIILLVFVSLFILVLLWGITLKARKEKIKARMIATVGLFGAFSVCLYFINIPLPIFPSFLKMNLSLLPVVILGFMMGCREGITALLVRMMIKLPFSHTFCIGEATDFLIGLFVVLSSSLIYKRKRTKKGALTALSCAALLWVASSLLVNWLISVPFYIELIIGSKEAFIKALSIIPGVNETNYMIKYLFLAVMPFNLLQALIVDTVTFLVYKKTAIFFRRYYA